MLRRWLPMTEALRLVTLPETSTQSDPALLPRW
jgi:hypothetical protein